MEKLQLLPHNFQNEQGTAAR